MFLSLGGCERRALVASCFRLSCNQTSFFWCPRQLRSIARLPGVACCWNTLSWAGEGTWSRCWWGKGCDGPHPAGQFMLGWTVLEVVWSSLTQVREDPVPSLAAQSDGSYKRLRSGSSYARELCFCVTSVLMSVLETARAEHSVRR